MDWIDFVANFCETVACLFYETLVILQFTVCFIPLLVIVIRSCTSEDNDRYYESFWAKFMHIIVLRNSGVFRVIAGTNRCLGDVTNCVQFTRT